MDHSRSLYGAIAEIVRRETRYLRHYIGEVVDNQDELEKGRVRMTVPLLGWDTPAKGTWAWPRDKHMMSVPAVGEWVEMYFLNGDPNIPVYFGKAIEMLDQQPEAFDGDPNVHVIFQDPTFDQKIVFDKNTGVLSIGEGEEEFVLGTQLEDYLINTVKGVYNTHTHPYTWTGSPGAGNTSPPNQSMTDPSGILSERIKGE